VELPVPINDFWRNSVALLPSYGAAPADLATSLDLIRAGRVPVEELVTHRLPLGEAARGFRIVAGLEPDCSLKVILYPHHR
jgi:L-iditol 2-dehydrogenase